MFAHIGDQIEKLPFHNPHIVELAAGPGFLAEALLTRFPQMTYDGIDYSKPMIALAHDRLSQFKDRIKLHCANLNSDDWPLLLTKEVHAFVSNQALHDLGSEENVEQAYETARKYLVPYGMLLNADLVIPKDREGEYDPGKLKVSRHIEILRAKQYTRVNCTLDLGHYACIVAYST
jgi:hypothetical protein